MPEDRDENVRVVPGPPDGVAVAPAAPNEPDAKAQATPEAPPVKRAPSYIAHTIEEIPPADAAELLTNLEPREAATVAEFLDPETAAGVLAQMESRDAASVISEMEPPEAAMVLTEMNPDDAVDVLERIEDPARREALLGEMGAQEAADLRTLGQFPPDTAGGIMTTDITALPQDLTAQQAIDELRRLNETLEQMFYVYVIDRARRLVGVLSMRDLILARPERKIADIMRRNVVAVPATMDQEEVAQLIRKYKYMAVPVTDRQNRLLGLITVDDVVDVINEEATEDVQKMAGAGAEERLTSPWHFSFRKRIGWLIVNLGTAFMAASVIAAFQDTIRVLAILAAYQTIVSGSGGNASAQAMAVAIRGIALGEVDRSLFRRLIRREAIIGLFSGIVIGLCTATVAIIFNEGRHGLIVGGIVMIALMINHIMACVCGVAIPFLMKRLGFDPAQSATIFATTVTDCCGFFATLGLASLAIRAFGLTHGGGG
jgi:magnesium transporter